jgi:hypothetical protein
MHMRVLQRHGSNYYPHWTELVSHCDLLLSKANNLTVSNASHADQAVATACSYLFRSLGSVFGVSMCATAFNQTLRKSLERALRGDADAAEIAERVRAGMSYFRSLEPHLKDVVRDCYGEATRAALGVGIGLVTGSAVFAWFIREKKLGS